MPIDIFNSIVLNKIWSVSNVKMSSNCVVQMEIRWKGKNGIALNLPVANQYATAIEIKQTPSHWCLSAGKCQNHDKNPDG